MINTVEKAGCYTGEHVKAFIKIGRKKSTIESRLKDAFSIIADLANGSENIEYIREELEYWSETVQEQIRMDNANERHFTPEELDRGYANSTPAPYEELELHVSTEEKKKLGSFDIHKSDGGQTSNWREQGRARYEQDKAKREGKE